MRLDKGLRRDEALIVEVTDAGSTGDYINWTAKVDIVMSASLDA